MASLLTVNGERLELGRNRSYLLGRTPDCDVVVHDGACSRRHARLTLGGESEQITLQDLGSRNGTYVNERRVEGTASLRNHSRIRIGSTIYLLSLVDAGTKPSAPPEDLDDAYEMTISFPRHGAGRARGRSREPSEQEPGFAGQIGVFNLFEILSFLVGSKRSGTLHLAFQEGSGRVSIRNGEVWAASWDDAEGVEALERLVRREGGLFWLVEGDDGAPRTIHEPAAQLLARLFVAMDGSASA